MIADHLATQLFELTTKLDMSATLGLLEESDPSINIVLGSDGGDPLQRLPDKNVPAPVYLHLEKLLISFFGQLKEVGVTKQFQAESVGFAFAHLEQESFPGFSVLGLIFILWLGQALLEATPATLTAGFLEEFVGESPPSLEDPQAGDTLLKFIYASLRHDSRLVHIRLLIIVVVKDQLIVVIDVELHTFDIAARVGTTRPHLLKLNKSLSEPCPVLNCIKRPIVHRSSRFGLLRRGDDLIV